MDVRTERAERLRVVALEMEQIVKEIGPKWIRLAHLRHESQQIIEELKGGAGQGE